MASFYHGGSRELQERFDAVRLADRLEERTVHSQITDGDRAFMESVDSFFLATADADGHPTCSHKGGDPGFVRVIDSTTLAFPSYDGNGMFLSMGNVLVNPHVGMLFIDYESGWRLRVQGDAFIDPDDELLPSWPEAKLVVRVRVSEVFPNCPRYVHRRKLVSRSEFVPRDGCESPVPDWKTSSLARDVLPEGDPARAVSEPS